MASCPVKTPKTVSLRSPSDHTPGILTQVRISYHAVTVNLPALIDAGVDECMMNWGLAAQLGLEAKQLVCPIEVVGEDISWHK